jgi:hypothetical protein
METEILLFIRMFGSRWFVYMSSAPSVSLAVATLFVENQIAKIGLWTTAILCFWLAAFFVWREEHRKFLEEHEKVAGLAARLSPTINISLDGDGVSEDIDIHGIYTKRVQIVVQSLTNVPLIDCEILIEKVDRVEEKSMVSLMEEPLRPEWSNPPDYSKRFDKITIPEGISWRANLFAIDKEAGPLQPIIPAYKRNLVEGIAIPGTYHVRVAVSAKNARVAKRTFLLKWSDYEHVSLALTP